MDESEGLGAAILGRAMRTKAFFNRTSDGIDSSRVRDESEDRGDNDLVRRQAHLSPRGHQTRQTGLSWRLRRRGTR
eukprot:scaffold492_cov257-Pinguiococcus_pyrenoidosus.AAC.41